MWSNHSIGHAQAVWSNRSIGHAGGVVESFYGTCTGGVVESEREFLTIQRCATSCGFVPRDVHLQRRTGKSVGGILSGV